VVSTFLHRLARDETVEIWGDGSVVRDYLHVRDLADLCVRAAEAEGSDTLNAGSGTGLSLLDMIGHLQRVTGRPIAPVFRPGRPVDVPMSVLDVGRARAQLGWVAQTGLREGLAETWAWTQAQSIARGS
jgi:UDP-glucose 4-epimerase